MSNLETNIKSIQKFVDLCINKGCSSYSYSFSVKRELLNPDQAKAATEKELEKATDELVNLLRQNPILRTLSDLIETPGFLWESVFIETLSSLEKKKYAGFNTVALDTDAYMKNPAQYDEELPHLSAVINYGVLNGYISYLKRLIPAEEPLNIEEPAPVTVETPAEAIPANEPQDLESDFDDWQIDILVKCVNEVKIFRKPITAKTMKAILSCKLKEPLQVARYKNKLLAYFFSSLDSRSLITREWQSVCAKNGLFLSSGKGVVMQQGNFSSAVAQNNEFPPKDSHIIDNYMKQLKRD